MDVNLEPMIDMITQYLPRILGALAILVIGWLLALALSRGFRGILRKTGMNDHLPRWLDGGKDPDPAGMLAKILYYILMLFVLVGVFQALGLTMITEPLNGLLDEVMVFAPKLLAAGMLMVVALLLATGVRKLLRHTLTTARVDERLLRGSGDDVDRSPAISHSLAETAYWLIILLFLPAILGALEMKGLLSPVESMVSDLVGFLPQLLAATIIFLVGWFVARIVRRVVAGLLASTGADGFSARAGFGESFRLSSLAGGFVYVLILIPVAVAAMNALQLEAVTAPASRMLEMIMGAIPQIFAAALILVFSFVVGRFVANLVRGLLAGAGFDRIPAAVGLVPADRQSDDASRWAGTLVHVAIMLFAAIEAAGQLGFDQVSVLIAQFLVFAGQVALGLVILVVGMFLANLAGRAIHGTGHPQSRFLGLLARTAVLVLTGAMALREMGFADDIVNLAFGLLFGAVAVAVALAFGLGGKDFAGHQLKRWRQDEDDQNS